MLVRVRGVLDLGGAVVRGRRLGRSAAKEQGPVAVGPQGGRAVPVAGGQAVSEKVACGVEEAEEASQRARRADKPRRVPLWDDARRKEVSGLGGGTLGRVEASACGRLLRMGVACGMACGVGRAAEASQRARRAGGPRRVPLWDDARGEVVHGPCGSTLGRADTSACGRFLRVNEGVPHGWNVKIKVALISDARLALIPSNAWAFGNLADGVKRTGRRLR